jgi:hypothetical protein
VKPSESIPDSKIHSSLNDSAM